MGSYAGASAARLGTHASSAGLRRVDMLYLDSSGRVEARYEDIPFAAASGGVLVASRVDALRALPATTLRVRLLAVGDDGERTLGDYTFNHTPHAPPAAR